jgi:hypothetical protein
MSIAGLLISIFMGKKYGLYGVAIGNVSMLLPNTIYTIYRVCKFLNLSVKNFYLQIIDPIKTFILLSVILFATFLLIKYFFASTPELILIILYPLIASILVFFVALNYKERSFLLNIITLMKKKA